MYIIHEFADGVVSQKITGYTVPVDSEVYSIIKEVINKRGQINEYKSNRR